LPICGAPAAASFATGEAGRATQERSFVHEVDRRADVLASPERRRWTAAAALAGTLRAAGAAGTGGTAGVASAATVGASAPVSAPSLRLCTFGDSVLDCGHYNERGLDPGRLLVRNDDALFPEFAGRDLSARGPARLEHRAVDGATVDDLAAQARGFAREEPSLAIVSIGGNDLLRGLAADSGAGVARFAAALERFVRSLAVSRIVLGTVYDPTFGDDARNFLGVPAAVARANHRRVNDVIAALAARHGRLADLHAHFLRGDPSWFTRTIEPSLIGASEVRRVFLDRL
jgi:lysophospholipase L1-like esterase